MKHWVKWLIIFYVLALFLLILAFKYIVKMNNEDIPKYTIGTIIIVSMFYFISNKIFDENDNSDSPDHRN